MPSSKILQVQEALCGVAHKGNVVEYMSKRLMVVRSTVSQNKKQNI